MSFILLLEDTKLEEIVNHLPKYEQMIKDAEPIFKLEGRHLEEIIRTLPHYQSRYDQAVQEMKALDEWLGGVKDKRTAKLWKKYVEGYPKQLATRDVQAYIAGEKEIVELNQIAIEVTLIKNHLTSIVEAIKQMGWMVAHITKLRVAELNDLTL